MTHYFMKDKASAVSSAKLQCALVLAGSNGKAFWPLASVVYLGCSFMSPTLNSLFNLWRRLIAAA